MSNVVRLALNLAFRDEYLGTLPAPANPNAAITFHARAIDSHDPPDADDRLALIGAVYSWWETDGAITVKLRDRYYANVILNSISAQTVEPTVSDTDYYSVDEDGSHAPTGFPPFPPNIAFMVSLRTLVESRRYRGRLYLPPFADSQAWVNPGGAYKETLGDLGRVMLGKTVAQLAAHIALYEGDPVQQWALAVYSRVDGDAHAVTRFEVPARVATQRRRLAANEGYLTVGISGEPE